MKKTFISLAVALMATVMNAQTWTGDAKWSKSVTTGDPLSSLKVGADGSVYITGDYDATTAFGEITLANDDELPAGYVAKYNADGSEAWAIGFMGDADIVAIDVDAAGNAYVAVTITDEVVFSGTDGQANTVTSGDELHNALLIVKIDKDGSVLATKVIVSETNQEIAEQAIDWGDGPEPMYGGWDPIFVQANNLKVVDDKVYVSVSYKGDVKADNVDWKGSYVNVWDMMYEDNRSAGILTVDASDLGNAASVLNVQMTGVVDYAQYFPEGLNFAVANGHVYAGLFGFGNLTITANDSAKDLEFESDGEGMNEHGFLLVTIPTTVDPLTNTVPFSVTRYHAAAHERLNNFYNVSKMEVQDGNIYIAGVFNGELPFNTAKTSVGNCDMFVVSFSEHLNPAVPINWAVTSGYDEGTSSDNQEAVSCMIVNNGKVFAAGVAVQKDEDGETRVEPLTYLEIGENGATQQHDGPFFVGADDNQAGLTAVLTDNSKGSNATIDTTPAYQIAVYDSPVVTAIKSVETAPATADRIYNLNGQQVNQPQKGVYIMGGKKYVK